MSLTKLFGRKSDKSAGLRVYMDPIEFSQILTILDTLRARRVLEWGAGGSGKALLEACPYVERYVSIEHHEAWYERVKEHSRDPRLELVFVPPNQPVDKPDPTPEELIAWDARAEVEPAILADYVAHPRSLGIDFDAVLVDGRARRLCCAEGFELLRPGGVLILHDAQREQHHSAIEALGDVRFLEPWKQGQVAFVRKPD